MTAVGFIRVKLTRHALGTLIAISLLKGRVSKRTNQ
jgi:hypothetical protein